MLLAYFKEDVKHASIKKGSVIRVSDRDDYDLEIGDDEWIHEDDPRIVLYYFADVASLIKNHQEEENRKD